VALSANLLGVLAASTSAFIGGTAAVATRHLVQSVDPLMVALLRYTVAIACLLLVAALLGRLRLDRAELRTVVPLGILMFAGFPALFSIGLAHTTAARGALALSMMPVFSMALARLVQGEPLSARRTLGIVCAVAGVGWALAGDAGIAGRSTLAGDLVMLAAAVVGAVYGIASRATLARMEPMAFTLQTAAVGLVTLAAACLVTGRLSALPVLAPAAWLGILYLGLVAGAVAFWLWNLGLARTSATNVAVSVTVNPLAAMLFGALLLAEPLTANLFAGLLLVATGIALCAMAPLTAARPAAGRSR
jgi:drug/metabolite transporter (DMT)-like permease